MSVQATLLPSDRMFTVESRETILEAALRAGVSLAYGCANGSCGLCKARVVCGEVVDARFHDHTISAAEKQQGYVLLCSVQANCDVVIEAQTATGAQDILWQTIQARFSRITMLGATNALLNIRTPRSRVLRFLAGQHVTLLLPNKGTRTFSLANCPCDGMNLEFHLDADPVFAELKKGDPIEIRGPAGTFVLDDVSTRALVFVALDTAFAPVRSLIEQAMNVEMSQPIHLVWLTHASGEPYPYLHNLCRSWVEFWDGFRYQSISVDGTEQWSARLEAFLDQMNVLEADFYLSGRGEIIDVIERLIIERGAIPGRVFVNAFEHSRQ